MIEFIYHAGIDKEIKLLEKKHIQIREGLKYFERLCETQFNPTSPKSVIAPAKLHRISQNDVWTMWKVELVIPNSGLRPSQFPRMWLAVRGVNIAFLCIASHIDNYNDNQMNEVAFARVTDIF